MESTLSAERDPRDPGESLGRMESLVVLESLTDPALLALLESEENQDLPDPVDQGETEERF